MVAVIKVQRHRHRTHLAQKRWQSIVGVRSGGEVGCRHTVLFGARARRRSIVGVGVVSSVGGTYELFAEVHLYQSTDLLMSWSEAGSSWFSFQLSKFYEAQQVVVRHFTGMLAGVIFTLCGAKILPSCEVDRRPDVECERDQAKYTSPYYSQKLQQGRRIIHMTNVLQCLEMIKD